MEEKQPQQPAEDLDKIDIQMTATDKKEDDPPNIEPPIFEDDE